MKIEEAQELVMELTLDGYDAYHEISIFDPLQEYRIIVRGKL